MDPIEATVQPPVGHVHRLLCIFIGAGVRRAFVKCHNDICANFTLNVHHTLRRKQMFSAIDMARKSSTLFGDFALIR